MTAHSFNSRDETPVSSRTGSRNSSFEQRSPGKVRRRLQDAPQAHPQTPPPCETAFRPSARDETGVSSREMLQLIWLTLLLLVCTSWAGEPYSVEDIAPPDNVVPECGGLSFLPDGRLVAVFHHGEVYFYTPATKTWKLFAEGLHDPMGVLAISPTE